MAQPRYGHPVVQETLDLREKVAVALAQNDSLTDLERNLQEVIDHLDHLSLDNRQVILAIAKEYAAHTFIANSQPSFGQDWQHYLQVLQQAPIQFRNKAYAVIRLKIDNQKDVLGWLQKECESGDDAGDDEDGARREDIGSGLRGGRTVCAQVQNSSHRLTPS
jgi:hypothetical protein